MESTQVELAAHDAAHFRAQCRESQGQARAGGRGFGQRVQRTINLKGMKDFAKQ
jgi:hypothetical protein